MRVAQFIGQSGFTSRQKAKQLIDEKRITVNGKPATQSTKINEGDVVLVDGVDVTAGGKLVEKPKPKPSKGEATFIIYNKPVGIICTTEKIPDNIIDAINHAEKILPVGRLDKESEGLILLTNVGKVINRIINPKYHHEKEYVVTLNLPLTNAFIKAVTKGMDIGGERTEPCEIKIEPGTKRIFRIKLSQGLNRQIRKMCNKFGYQVLKLKRVRIMNLHLGNLKPGEWRNLTEDELSELLALIY